VIRAVLDTNQYVSMAIKAGGTADRLLAAWREERFVLLLSPPILDEIIRVLRYPRLRLTVGESSETRKTLRRQERSLLVSRRLMSRLARAGPARQDGPYSR